jgi:hypothetical protein
MTTANKNKGNPSVYKIKGKDSISEPIIYIDVTWWHTHVRAITISTEFIPGGRCLMLVKMLTRTAPGPSLKASSLSLFELEFMSLGSSALLAETLFPSAWPFGRLPLLGSCDAPPSSLEPFSRGAESETPCASSLGSRGISSAKYSVTDIQNKRNTCRMEIT